MSGPGRQLHPIPVLNRWHLRTAVRALEAGGIIAYPTEAVYALGCSPYDAQTVLKLLRLKQRPLSMGLVLIAAHFRQFEPLLAPLPARTVARVQASWPGPVTWTWPCRPEAPVWLRGDHDTLAVRVTAHPLAAALCEAFGTPLVSTSANLSGHPPARTPLRVRGNFGNRIDYILHGALGALEQVSEIRDARSNRVLRGG